MNKNFIDGATLLGVGLTLFALRNIGGQINWQYFIMIGASVFFFVSSIITFWSKKKKK